MNKLTQLLPFMQTLFDDPTTARKASAILAGTLKARSPRLSEIGREMYGGEAANNKTIQRFLDETDPQAVLLRLFQEEASFGAGSRVQLPGTARKPGHRRGELRHSPERRASVL